MDPIVLKQTVLKVSLAGLFHDIGKLAHECLELPTDYETNNADIYLPFNKKEGRHTHIHALYTAAFIETHAKFLPKELNSPDWGEGEKEDSFINLSAKHHKPETPLQWIITQADRLSSGFDRTEFEKGEEIAISEVSQTRLLPIFERLLRTDKAFDKREDFAWRYPLKPLSATSIFPIKREGVSKKDAKDEYRLLFEEFCKKLESLCHRHHVELWAQHFDSLYRLYVSHVPAARVGKIVHDVSLYDHSRTTAALAGALYLYHRLTDTLEERAIKDDSLPKFLLVSGDFYGIQDFIFRGGGEERHHRAKLLRGRSFLVSLLIELAAEMLCDRLGLTFLSVFFSAAGKFHLLAPNLESTHQIIKDVHEEINHWFYEHFFGECAMGFATTTATPEDLSGGRFSDLWDRHLKNLEEAKFQRFDLERYGGVYEGYLDSFRNDLPRPLCPLCGRRPSAIEVQGDKFITRKYVEEEACACKLCRDQAYIGTNLVKGSRLAIVKDAGGGLKEPLFGYYQIQFLNGCARELADQGKLIKLYDLNITSEGNAPVGATFLPINGYVPVYQKQDDEDDRLLAGERTEKKKLELIDLINEGVPKTFYHLAQSALIKKDGKFYGLPVLAVLKADVDNLGAIFGCGLPKKLFTLSRLATMSRQLHNFFTVYLPYALKNEQEGRFKNIYTVFAGGDDLFLIGPWNVMREFALFLQEKFSQYVCENPELHFSAGITLHKPHVPVDLLARESESALNEAKAAGKNRISMFGRVATWQEFRELSKIEQDLFRWYEEFLTRSTLYRLNELCALAEEAQKLISLGYIPWARLTCVKWPAYLRYFLVRTMKRELGDQWEAPYQQIVTKIYEWFTKYGGRLVMALWPLLYNTRKQSL